MIKKSIITGIGIIVLLMLTGSSQATPAFFTVSPPPDCSFCHKSDLSLKPAGIFFNATHRFNGTGTDLPETVASCTTCHVKIIAPSDFSLTSTGQSYNKTHRYNDTTLASARLDQPGCYNCHVDVIGGNFNFLTGTPTYLTSTVCVNCHKAKYDKWTNTLHRVMLTPANKAQAMNLPTPPGYSWGDIGYVVVSKFSFLYMNTTGYWLAQSNTYDTETKTWGTGETPSAPYGTCARCHTTGWNTNAKILPGISGTFSEPGIACERCHGPAGNGHQVVVNYSAKLCEECHSGSNHGTGYDTGSGEHSPPAAENGTSCMQCHSPFDQYKNPSVPLANTIAVTCGVCHNIHNMTDNKYADTFSNGNFVADTWSEVANANIGFFNATASLAAGTDIIDTLSTPALLYPGTDTSRKDASYGTAPINVTGPVSEVLCSKCHYRHGLAHTAGVNLTHSRMNYPQSKWATCTDCHMKGTNATVGKDMMKNHANTIFDFLNSPNSASADPANSCGGTTQCHTASSQSLSASSHSIVPIFNGWNASAHNDKVVSIGGAIGNHFFGTFNATTGYGSPQPNTCLQCKSPQNWNPANKDNITKIPLTDFHGVTCMVCHNIHDMGDWLKKTQAKYGVAKAYGFYNKTAIITATDAKGVPTRYQAAYTMMDNTTMLCGNCHTNIRAGNTGPGWASATATTPTSPHGVPAADVFAGSWKQTGLLNFECIDCHMATMTTDSNGNVLPDSQKVGGHSFKINATLLQNKTDSNGNPECSSCHVAITASTKTASKPGNLTVLFTPLGNVSQTIAGIQAKTHAKWNTTNATVISALNTIKAYNGEKNLSRTLIAQAYWNVRLVSSDLSWGVHNPTKVNGLLDDAVSLANQATAAIATPALVSSITPTSRNAVVGKPGTIFMSVINGGTAIATGVTITQASSLPVTVSYQQWNGVSFTGSPNTPVDIPAGSTANFVLTITPTAAFGTSSVTYNVAGTNTAPAPISGVNTLTMSASTGTPADVIMMSTNLNVQTAVNTPTALAVATSNVGATATGVSLNVVVPSSITGLVYQVNQTNPTTGTIIGPATGLTINAGAQPSFAVFLTPTQKIALDLVNNRITLQLKDGSGNVIGAQSVAISTT
ncbi:MAG: ammonia-forming cytochrome c nitrite reductase subunit c552 [Candidatus Methanoperedens sp.]|nr:ammonia-forming cytochrome c nitrite reductase subunit c552 [Candidatus Methanoperedens sp.]